MMSNSKLFNISLILLCIVCCFYVQSSSCARVSKTTKTESKSNSSSDDSIVADVFDAIGFSFDDDDDAVKSKTGVDKSDTYFVDEKRGSNHHFKKFMKRIMPIFFIPIIIQSAIIPMFLASIKMMLMKSLLVGKLALLLVAINALRSSNFFKSRSEDKVMEKHYGYYGNPLQEIGSYFNSN